RVLEFAQIRSRQYFDCATCRLVHLAPECRLGREDEARHYALHENDPADAAYRAFLERLTTPLAERLPAGAQGLDFGSGPGPTLSFMLEELGFDMQIYDPFFASDPALLLRTYDFIACTETVEHFFSPADEFDLLDRMVRPGGWLGIMTGLLTADREFADWHYVRDPTHVSLYRPATMDWIAARYGWNLQLSGRDVVLFRKPNR
ncbi:MAG TPA: class I SAM-dependent methyltransferase, partial [Burkholderiales bacterium]|nr:class I SAM-dependent methyltransferase [Burkholderiales bacterium]